MKCSDLIQKKKILIAGDVMLDVYYNGRTNRISPEAPVPIFTQKSRRVVLGGAANVATNVAANMQEVYLTAVVGDDDNGRLFCNMALEAGIKLDYLITDKSRKTTTKTRYLAQNSQQIFRVDEEDTDSISSDLEDELLERLLPHIRDFDVIVVSDYLKGFLTERVLHEITNRARLEDVKVFIDVKDSNYHKYDHAFLLKPNQKELQDLTKRRVQTIEEIAEASAYLCKDADVEYVLTTCGGQGMVLADKHGKTLHVDCTSKTVFDVTGAGDTVIAFLSIWMANGISLEESVRIANIAAGIQVSKLGTSVVYLSEIDKEMKSMETGSCLSNKRMEFGEACELHKRFKNQKIVFTNGCFDIIHTGHIRYLQQAAALGDILIVAVNSDDSVKRLKGPERPINGQEDRCEVLAAMEFIDFVVIFEQDTPAELISAIKPDVLVKGGDYTPDQVVGKDIVEAYGGRVEIIPFVQGKSSTSIIHKIRQD